jgi:protein-disulfide isomerase
MLGLFRSLLMAAALLLPQAAAAGEFTDKQREEIGTIVREYLLQNPDVLMEVSQELERRRQLAEEEQRKQALTANAAEIFRSQADLVAGNPQGSVTMVEFFDYNCAWCKKGVAEVLKLIDTDKDLRFVLKEFPIFGEDSEYAARAGLASQAQGKYWPFHLAMLQHEGKVSKEAVDEIAAAQGLDMARLRADMDAPAIADTIVRNQALARTLAINGTPAFVVDTKVIPGYLPHDGLLAAVKEVRDAGGCSIC